MIKRICEDDVLRDKGSLFYIAGDPPLLEKDDAFNDESCVEWVDGFKNVVSGHESMYHITSRRRRTCGKTTQTEPDPEILHEDSYHTVKGKTCYR